MLFSSRADDYNETSLYRYFHEFHSEIMAIKQSPEETLRIQQRLIGLLEKQRMDASQHGGERHATLYRETQYLMVAFADEVFLHLLDWEGQEAWRVQLLEWQIFNSQVAGQQVFDNLEELLTKRDPHTQELARLYLIVLSLGFQGKYRHSEDPKQLSEYSNYRRRLYFFITGRSADSLYDYLHNEPSKRIFPDAYKYTLEPQNEKRQWLPSLRWWHVSFWVVGLILFLISLWVWQTATSDLEQKADQIIRQHSHDKE